MSSPPKTTVLVTGATRGIGLGLVTRYLTRSNHVVIAAVRDPSGASSKTLESLPRASGTSLIVVKIDLTSSTDPADAVSQLNTAHGIDRLDVVIANAGIAEAYAQVSQIKVDDFQRHMTANVYGFVWLYQATLPLLNKTVKPLLVYIGSAAGLSAIERGCVLNPTAQEIFPIPNAIYGPSKLVGHYLTKSIHQEETQLIAFPMSPGWVQTDMGNRGATLSGLEKAPQTLEESIVGMMNVFDAAERETHGGKFWAYDGTTVAW
ncbi:MAG: hypothetical protein Q9160_004035 [Pyrenula sp. 1 TL-2023]